MIPLSIVQCFLLLRGLAFSSRLSALFLSNSQEGGWKKVRGQARAVSFSLAIPRVKVLKIW